MNKIRLTVKSVTEIVGNKDVGLVVLVDENEQRQIAIPCDYQMLYQLQLRIQNIPITPLLLPEVLWHVVRSETTADFEILIHDVIDGQYRCLLMNNSTFEPYTIRVSDALLLSLISKTPIYMDENLMKKQSVAFKKDSKGMSIPLNTLTDDMLKKALNKAIEEENYEMASHLRDEMKRRNLLDTNDKK